MHLKRWITSLVAIPLLVLIISIGGTLWLAVVINVICIMALWEYFCMVLNKDQYVKAASFQILAFISGTAVLWAAYFHVFNMVLDIIVLNVIISTLISLPKFKSDSSVWEIVFKQVVGIIYIPLFLSYIVLIRNGNNGVLWVFLLLTVVFMGDTGAYYLGSYFGKHKLCPAISPNKTIEGALGGLAASLGSGALIKTFFLPLLPWGLSLLFFSSIGIAGQVGDLFESQLKRVAHIKDSGAILPGHGGVLDRIDALLFAAPVAYIFKEYLLT
ncbi:MAG TPA: phosphatidate cytidylyltransferase [Desulfobacteraceae bacterium]|nr:phosphatidate cytidylyltransferase [Desulfobacteraceae bacterium]